jgi:hypothetical protein
MTIKESPWALEKQKGKKKILKEMLRAELQWAKNLKFCYQKKLKSSLKKRSTLLLFKKKKKTYLINQPSDQCLHHKTNWNYFS